MTFKTGEYDTPHFTYNIERITQKRAKVELVFKPLPSLTHAELLALIVRLQLVAAQMVL